MIRLILTAIRCYWMACDVEKSQRRKEQRRKEREAAAAKDAELLKVKR